MEVLRATGKDRVRVTAEAIVKKFPAGYDYAVLSGMDEMLSLLADLDVDVEAMEEGTLFFPSSPSSPSRGRTAPSASWRRRCWGRSARRPGSPPRRRGSGTRPGRSRS